MALCDRVSVMKNGKLVGTVRVEDVTEDDILGMIILGKQPAAASSDPKGRKRMAAFQPFPVAFHALIPEPFQHLDAVSCRRA